MDTILEFSKYDDGLIPAVIQDNRTLDVLMVGFMDQAAYEKTIAEKRVTFFSRSKARLWTKGEESGNFLELVDIKADCDSDTLLIRAVPQGPVCHTGTDTCFGNREDDGLPFLNTLEEVIRQRRTSASSEKSYVASLFKAGVHKIAQKVGEEAVELVLESKDNNDEAFLNEAADLLFHYLVLLNARDKGLADVSAVLRNRHKQ